MLDDNFRTEAAFDLIAIFRHGAEECGVAVALDWRGGLDQILGRLQEFPAIGRPRPDLAAGLRSWSYRSHIMFYVADDDMLTIARVLHQRMDPDRHGLGG